MRIPPTSIIIPTLNEEKYIPALLSSLVTIPAPLDVIVVDGNSTDGTARVVEEFQASFSGESSLRFIALDERGISLQRNTGAALARHSILMFCDADLVIPSVEAYGTLVSAFHESGHAVAAPTFVPIEPVLHARIVYRLLILVQRIVFTFGKPYFAGACLLTTKHVFAKVGGFDERIPLGEDVDYSLKAARHGSSGLFRTHMHVSARRLIKYGYRRAFRDLPEIFRLLTTGRVNHETIFYPFGDFGDLKR